MTSTVVPSLRMDADDPETTLEPTCAAPELAELAWSVDDDDGPPRQQWRTVWGAAIAVVIFGVVAAIVIVIGHHAWRVHQQAQAMVQAMADQTSPPSVMLKTAVAAAPAPPAVPPPVAAPTVTVTTTASPSPTSTPQPMHVPTAADDNQYIAAVQRGGMTIINRDAAITAGHAICVALAQGHSQDEIASGIVKTNPTFNSAGAYATIAAAVNVYCPEQRRGD
jgi:hypothetical protein